MARPNAMPRCVWLLGLLCGFVLAPACTTVVPDHSSGARSQIIGTGILALSPPDPGDTKTLLKFKILPALTTSTQILPARATCEGAVGSVLPPMMISECVTGIVLMPLDVMEKLLSAVAGPNPLEKHVWLPGADRYWVHQSKRDDCWAATLEIARGIDNLRPISQDNILALTRQECPALQSEGAGADAFQIAYAIKRLLFLYDGRQARIPHFCANFKCVTDSLTEHHPVIMLKSGHVVLIVGAYYETSPEYPAVVVLKRLEVLDPLIDPGQSSRITTVDHMEACGADMFISY